MQSVRGQFPLLCTGWSIRFYTNFSWNQIESCILASGFYTVIELLLLCQQKVVYNLLDHPVRPMENICCSMGEDSNGPISNLSLNTRLTHPFPFPNPYPISELFPILGLDSVAANALCFAIAVLDINCAVFSAFRPWWCSAAQQDWCRIIRGFASSLFQSKISRIPVIPSSVGPPPCSRSGLSLRRAKKMKKTSWIPNSPSDAQWMMQLSLRSYVHAWQRPGKEIRIQRK